MCWNRTLDQMAKQRQKLYQNVLTASWKPEREANRKLDEVIKKTTSINKYRREKAHLQNLKEVKRAKRTNCTLRLLAVSLTTEVKCIPRFQS